MGKTVTTTVRLPAERNETIRKMAAEIGVSQNAMILMLVELGLRVIENAGQASGSE